MDNILEHEIDIDVMKNTQIYLKSRLLTCRQNAKTIKHTPESLHMPDVGIIETVYKNVELDVTKQHGHAETAKLHEKHKQRHQHRGNTENEIHTMGKDFVVGDAHRLANNTNPTSTTTTEHTMTTPSEHGENHSLMTEYFLFIYFDLCQQSLKYWLYHHYTIKSHTEYHILCIQVL